MSTYNKKNSGITIARKNKGMTEAELANKLKIDTSTIKSWESGGGSIPIDIIKKISKILEVSSDMILFGEDRKPLITEHLTEEQQKAIRTLYRLMKEK